MGKTARTAIYIPVSLILILSPAFYYTTDLLRACHSAIIKKLSEPDGTLTVIMLISCLC